MWKNKTNKGRVIYDRKKNIFRCSDVLRISKNVFPDMISEENSSDSACLASVLDITIDTIIRIGDEETRRAVESYLRQRIKDLRRTFSFAGGLTGGAGATREF